MKYIIKSFDKEICEAVITGIDESMGVLSGPFIPLKDYKSIGQLIKETSEESFEVRGYGSEKLRLLHKRIEELQLKAYTMENKELECVGISLIDFSDTLGDEGYEVHLLGCVGYEKGNTNE